MGAVGLDWGLPSIRIRKGAGKVAAATASHVFANR